MWGGGEDFSGKVAPSPCVGMQCYRQERLDRRVSCESQGKSTSQRAEFAGLREDLPDRGKNHNAVGARSSLEQLLGCSLGLWSVLCPCVPMMGLRPPAFSCLSVLSLGRWQ